MYLPFLCISFLIPFDLDLLFSMVLLAQILGYGNLKHVLFSTTSLSVPHLSLEVLSSQTKYSSRSKSHNCKNYLNKCKNKCNKMTTQVTSYQFLHMALYILISIIFIINSISISFHPLNKLFYYYIIIIINKYILQVIIFFI